MTAGAAPLAAAGPTTREASGRPAGSAGAPPCGAPNDRADDSSAARRDDRSAMAKSTKLVSAFGFLIAIGGLYKGHELLLIASHSGDSHDSLQKRRSLQRVVPSQSRAEPAPRPSSTTTTAPPATTTPAPSTARPPATAAAAAAAADGSACPPGRRPYHVIMTAASGNYQEWQSRIAYFHYQKQKRLNPCSDIGGFHRLFNNVGGKPDRMMDEIPTILVHQLGHGRCDECDHGFIVMNRPWGVLQLVRGDAWKAIPEVRNSDAFRTHF